jgi:hypothetical protein
LAGFFVGGGFVPNGAKFVACPCDMFGVRDEPAKGINQTYVVGGLGTDLAAFGVKPDEAARLEYRLAQQLKPRFLDGARIALDLGLRRGLIGNICLNVNAAIA